MKTILQYVFVTRLFLVLLACSSFFLFPYLKETTLFGNKDVRIQQGDHVYDYVDGDIAVKSMWSVWDSKWYISIADDGYSNQRPPYQFIDNKGFLPLYAVLIGFVSRVFVFGDTILAGIIVSNIFLILSLWMIKKFTESDEQLKDSVKINHIYLYILFFPLSYYLSSVYPESLFLFLSTASLYFLNKKKLKSASMLIGLSMITKIYGGFLMIPWLFYVLREKKNISIKQIVSSLALIGIFPLLYLLHMYQVSGDIFAYSNIQNTHFGHYWGNPLEAIILDIFFRGNIQSLLNGVTTVFGITLIFFGIKRMKIEYSLYSLAYLLLPPLSGTTNSNARYMTGLVFIPILLSLCVKKEESRYILIYIFSCIQGFTILWWVVGAPFVA